MLEALICSGIYTDGLIEAYIIFDHLSVLIILCIFLIIFYCLAIHGGITLEVMLRPQISLHPVILLIGYLNLTLIFTGSGRIILAIHQGLVAVLAQEQLSGLRYIHDSIRATGYLAVGIRGRGNFLNGRLVGILIRPCYLLIAAIRLFLLKRNGGSAVLFTVIIGQLNTIYLRGLDILF